MATGRRYTGGLVDLEAGLAESWNELATWRAPAR